MSLLSRWRFHSAVLACSLAATSWAQDPPANEPLIDRAKQMTVIAAQKVEADIRLSLREAAKLEKTAPAEAVAKLKQALAILDSDTNLSAARKATLNRVVRDRIRSAEAPPPSAETMLAQEKSLEAKQAAAKADAEKRATESKQVKESIAEAAKLRKEGKTAQAEKLVAELAQKFPQDLTVNLITGKEGFDKTVAAQDKQKATEEKAFTAVMRDVDKAGVPATGDIEFPKDWKERTKHRFDTAAPTPQERKLMSTLERPVDVQYKGSTLQNVLSHLAETLDLPIHAEAAALTEAGATLETPVNFSVRQPLAARTTLRTILSGLNLTYVVRDGMIHVTTPARAKDLMTTKTYYIGDLMTGLGPMGGAPTVGFMLDQAQSLQNVTAIVEMIKGSVDPASWEGRNGYGAIGVNLPTMSLIVRQSQEVHAMLRGSLYGPPVNRPAPKP